MVTEENVDKLSRDDLYSLEQYSEVRPKFRRDVMEHKRHRVLQIGPAVTLHFEDRMTMQYQVQEMLRVEKIFDREGIEDELGAYNPLIPDGSNWKATMMVEFPDADERKVQLSKLIGIERATWVQVEGHDKVYPIANEDPFTISGTGIECMHPRGSGDPAQDINCGCTSISRYPDDSMRSVLDRYRAHGFLSYDQLVKRDAARLEG